MTQVQQIGQVGNAAAMIAGFRETVAKVEAEVGKVIVGQRQLVREVLTCMLAGGNGLLEGVPGLGKTALVRTLAQVIDCSFDRVQFTPDMMPADIIGTNIIVENEESGRRGFQFQPGALFANLVLADEINRATPKTQSALLEAMQEGTVSVARKTHILPKPFFVLATQNPLEMEGTYPLPEAQLDRFFFKMIVPFPSADELLTISDRTTSGYHVTPHKATDGATILAMQELAKQTPIASHVTRYAVRIILASHPDIKPTALVKRFVRYGASPRGLQAMILGAKINALLDGRFNVGYKDIRGVATSALRHRLILNFDGDAEGISADTIVANILEEVKEED